MPKVISLPLDDDLHAAIDSARGSVPRTVWIREAIGIRLNRPGPPLPTGPVTMTKTGPDKWTPLPPRDGTTASPPSVSTVGPDEPWECPHPKAARRNLGYAVRCGDCGWLV